MFSRLEIFRRRFRRLFNRSLWSIRLLGLSTTKASVEDPGLVMVQIDGFSHTQFQRALKDHRLPFLKHLIDKEHYRVHQWYSGLPSTTPGIQGELFYGVKGCVPSFCFKDHASQQAVWMMDSDFVGTFEAKLKRQGEGLLAGGSAYSNIFTGGAKEPHFCFGDLGWKGIWHAINPFILPLLILLYIDIFLRTLFLLVIEFFLAVFECIRGTIKGQLFMRELELVWLRVLVCVFLREIIVAGACIDIMRGLPIIHLNFLGYDEQAHGRGPASNFAHWSLRGIDDCVGRIQHAIHHSPARSYDLWIYSDHGQQKTSPYLVKYGRSVGEAIVELFEKTSAFLHTPFPKSSRIKSRASLLRSRKGGAQGVPLKVASFSSKVIVTAIGPEGQIYLQEPFSDEQLDLMAQKLVNEVKIPLVMARKGNNELIAWTPRGRFLLPRDIQEIIGEDHPFIQDIKEDLIRMCYHPSAGDLIFSGWSWGQAPISFPLEYGSHGGLGVEETRAFALLPLDAPVPVPEKGYLRPLDLRQAALRFLKKEPYRFCIWPPRGQAPKTLRLISYNVHGCLGMDGAITTDRIARVIARHDPDFVALQELDMGRPRSSGMDQSERIARKLEMKYHFHPVFSVEDEHFGNAILSRYPMTLIKMAALPQLAQRKHYEPRGALWVAAQIEGQTIQIINTHLSYWPLERLAQVDCLLGDQWLASQEAQGPIILCGDLNLFPGSSFYKKICRRLNDSQIQLNKKRPYQTWSSSYPIGRIDYAFMSPEFRVQTVTVPRTSLDKIASDHLPLVVEFVFNNPAPKEEVIS